MAQLINSNVTGTLNVSAVLNANSNVAIANNIFLGSSNANATMFFYGTTVTGAPAPAANTLGLYSKNVANLMLLFMNQNTSNTLNTTIDIPLQSHIGYRDVFRYMPGGTLYGGAAVTINACIIFSDGMSMNLVCNGTPTIITPIIAGASVSQFAKGLMRRVQINANSTLLANANAWYFCNTPFLTTSNGLGSGNGGGFLYITTFAVDKFAGTNTCFFTGLTNISSVLTSSNVDPLVNTTQGMWGVGSNSNTGNLKIVCNQPGGTKNTYDLGFGFAFNTAATVAASSLGLGGQTSDMYELTIYAAANSATINFRVRNLCNGAEATLISSNTPNANLFLGPTHYIIGNTSAGSVTNNAVMSIVRGYVEKFYG
jgi:hypothetical protein